VDFCFIRIGYVSSFLCMLEVLFDCCLGFSFFHLVLFFIRLMICYKGYLCNECSVWALQSAYDNAVFLLGTCEASRFEFELDNCDSIQK